MIMPNNHSNGDSTVLFLPVIRAFCSVSILIISSIIVLFAANLVNVFVVCKKRADGIRPEWTGHLNIYVLFAGWAFGGAGIVQVA